jgi:protein ImuB
VAVCSEEAEAAGVREGMPLAEALALRAMPAGGDPWLAAAPCDPAADRITLGQLAEACERYSPLVALETAPEPECLWLDVSGLGGLFGGDDALSNRLRANLEGCGWRVRIGAAETPAASWALARFPLPLSELPVEALRLDPALVRTLRELGLAQVGLVESVNRASLASRFGPALIDRLDQLHGRRPELLIPHRPAPPCEARWSPEDPIDRWEHLEEVLRRLLEQLLQGLADPWVGVTRFECVLFREAAEALEVVIGLYRPSRRAAYLLELLSLRLAKAGASQPVTTVRLKVLATARIECRQLELFPEEGELSPAGPQARALAELIDHLASRLGAESVVRPFPVWDAQPEDVCRYEPLVASSPGSPAASGMKQRSSPPTGQPGAASLPQSDRSPVGRKTSPRTRRARAARRTVADSPWPNGSFRPLRLARRPIPLEALAIAPEGPPIRFAWAGREYRVAVHWGPERIETGWWRGRPIRRDYYRVETDEGSRYWLFRRLRDGRWFLHGWFE